MSCPKPSPMPRSFLYSHTHMLMSKKGAQTKGGEVGTDPGARDGVLLALSSPLVDTAHDSLPCSYCRVKREKVPCVVVVSCDPQLRPVGLGSSRQMLGR
jgi:hypothetical protein